MAGVLVVLAVLVDRGRFLLRPDFLARATTAARDPSEFHHSRAADFVLSVVIALLGLAGAACSMPQRCARHPARTRMEPLHRCCRGKYYIDELYEAAHRPADPLDLRPRVPAHW